MADVTIRNISGGALSSLNDTTSFEVEYDSGGGFVSYYLEALPLKKYVVGEQTDGFAITAGSTSARTLTVTGADVTLNQDLQTTDSPTFAALTVNGNITVTGTVDGVDVAALKTDVDGFPDELKNLTAAEIGELENIGSTTISAAQWGYLGASDQGIATTDSPAFAAATIPTIYGSASSGGSLTLYSTSHATKGNLLFGTSAYDETNNRLGIGTASPGAKLDVEINATTDVLRLARTSSRVLTLDFSGATTNFELDGGTVYWDGAGNGMTLFSDNKTDATTKENRIGVRHYTNAEEPFLFWLGQSTSANNQLNIGGGSGLGNAATIIRFLTAANNTTTSGTERMRISSSGNVGIGTSSPANRLDIADGAMKYDEMTAPSAPAANSVVIFARDNGGKTELCARFSTGAIQQLAIEP